MKKKILYITGSRADFGRVYYILKALQQNHNFELIILATAMHLSAEFGNTIKEIEKEFEVAFKVKSMPKDDSKRSMVESFGNQVIKITPILDKIKPDLVIVLGDRGEMLAGAISAKYQGIPVAHIGGGHISGSIDDKIRNALTIFSDLHFVANIKGKKRVISLGVSPSETFIVGAPDLEAIRKSDFLRSKEILQRFNINLNKQLILLSFHPTVSKNIDNKKEIEIVCESVLSVKNVNVIATYPNADSGGRDMIKILEGYSKHPQFMVYKNIPYKEYLGLMNIASVIVGNSSAGIIEAASFKLPAVNIGSRQNERERSGNVIDVKCKKDEIINAIKLALYNEKFKNKIKNINNVYGDGNTSKSIIEILKNYFSI